MFIYLYFPSNIMILIVSVSIEKQLWMGHAYLFANSQPVKYSSFNILKTKCHTLKQNYVN